MKFLLIALAAAVKVDLEWDNRTDCDSCKWVLSACVSWNEADGKFCRQNEGTRAGICGDKGRYNQATCESVFPPEPKPEAAKAPEGDEKPLAKEEQEAADAAAKPKEAKKEAAPAAAPAAEAKK